MKNQIAIAGLAVLIATPAADAGRPTLGSSSSRERDASADESGDESRDVGLKALFKGLAGELREGGRAVQDSFRDLRGDNGRDNASDSPESRSRYGFQTPPPPPLQGEAGFRAPRKSESAPSPVRTETKGNEIPVSAPPARTQPRLPSPRPSSAPQKNSPAPPRKAPEPEAPRVTLPEPAAIPSKAPETATSAPRPPAPDVSDKNVPEIVKPLPDAPAPEPSVDPEEEPAANPVAKDETAKPLPEKPAKPVKPEYPTATATQDPGIVKSPYPPHDLLDVKGMAPGSLAKDPATAQIFRVP